MIAKITIQASLRNGVTYLKQSYFTPPFKIANITEDKQARTLHLTLMCSSPGVLDGDDYSFTINVDTGAALQLHTQSYQRLFDMQYGATQSMEVTVEEGASFTYLPHPSVPHLRSIFTAKNRLFLASKCSLIWGEIFTCGRMTDGEIFTFTKYHSITEIFVHNKLVIKENLLMQPELINIKAMGQLEGFTHQASFIYLNETVAAKALTDIVYDYLEPKSDIIFGVTIAPANGIVVRILGYKAEQLFSYLQKIAELIKTIAV